MIFNPTLVDVWKFFTITLYSSLRFKSIFLYCRDNVEWDREQEERAKAKVAENSSVPMDSKKIDDLEEKADAYWDTFYGKHENRYLYF